MRLLELFCGTKSVGKKFEEIGYEVISLDYNPKFNATHTEDFLTWNYKQYPSDHFDIIWASPGGFPKATHIWSNIQLWDNEIKPVLGTEHYELKYRSYENKLKKIYTNFCSRNAMERSKIPPDLIHRIITYI